MTAEIPEHLRNIEFKPWHFYAMKNNKTGKMMHTLNSNFVDEMMRELKLTHTAEVSMIPYGENGIIVSAEVHIFAEDNAENATPGHASVTRMPREDGQTSFAQLAVTRALSVALRRRLGISKHDIEMVVEATGIAPETIKTREYSNSPIEEAEELPIDDVGLDLDI